MTREDIIRMAQAAGFMNVQGGLTDDGELSDYWDCWPKQLEKFAALVAAAEAKKHEWDIHSCGPTSVRRVRRCVRTCVHVYQSLIKGIGKDARTAPQQSEQGARNESSMV